MPENEVGIGYDSSIGIEGATENEFDEIAEVVSIGPPGMTRDAVEKTHLKSPEQWKEFIAGLKEGGEASVGLNYVPSSTDAVVAAFDKGKGRFQIKFPNGVTMTFAGVVTAFEPGELTNDKMTATLKIKCSGKPVLAAAAAS